MLTPEQRTRYERDGFLHLPAFLPAARLAELSRWADELLHATDRSDFVRKYGDDAARDRGEAILSRVEYARPHHAGMAALYASDEVRAPLRELLGDEPALFKDKLNYKLPGSDGFSLHQDVQAGWHAYARDFVTLLLAIDPMTRDNGCLELVPGAHRAGMLGPEWTPLTAADLGARSAVAVEAAAGDAIVFGGLVPHGSAPNRTDAPRRALLLTYNPRAQGDHYERYFADKRASFPPDVERAPGREYRYRV